MTIFYMRVVCLVLWTAAGISLAPSALRYIRGHYMVRDEYQTAFFFTALLFIGSLSRWLLFPDDQTLFAGLYALTGALAVYVLVLARQGRLK